MHGFVALKVTAYASWEDGHAIPSTSITEVTKFPLNKLGTPWGDILQSRSCNVPCPATTPSTIKTATSNASSEVVDEAIEVDTGIRIGGQKMKMKVEDKSEAVGKLRRFKEFIVGKSVEDAMARTSGQVNCTMQGRIAVDI